MAETKQEYIDELISFIEQSVEPESVTNVMVAALFAFLNDKCKSLVSDGDTLRTEFSEAKGSINVLAQGLQLLKDDQHLSQSEIERLGMVIDSLVGENASEAIDNFREILAFLDGVKDTEKLAGLLENIRQAIVSLGGEVNTHAGDTMKHISLLNIQEETDVDDDTGRYVYPGIYRVQVGLNGADGEFFLINAWDSWDYLISQEEGSWKAPVFRMKVNSSGVWVQSGTYSSDSIYNHGGWKALGAADNELSNAVTQMRTEVDELTQKPFFYVNGGVDSLPADANLKRGVYVFNPHAVSASGERAVDLFSKSVCIVNYSDVDYRGMVNTKPSSRPFSRHYVQYCFASGAVTMRTGIAGNVTRPLQLDPSAATELVSDKIEWGDWTDMNTGTAMESYTDEEIEKIAGDAGGIYVPLGYVEPMTNPEVQETADAAEDT